MSRRAAVDFGSNESSGKFSIHGKPVLTAVSTTGDSSLITALVMVHFTDTSRAPVAIVSNAIHQAERLRSLDVHAFGQLKKDTEWIRLMTDYLLCCVVQQNTRTVCLGVPESFDRELRSLFLNWMQELFVKLKERYQFSADSIVLADAAISPIYQHFKESPAQWNAVYIEEYSFRQMMEIYLTSLLRMMVLLNKQHTDAAEEDGDSRFTLVLGVPATTDWLDDKYRAQYIAMAKRAAADARLNVEHVELFSEPYAAALSFLNSKDKPDISCGFASIDAGGLTTDGIYLSYTPDGPRHYAVSTRLTGGALIESRMLSLLLEKYHISKLDLMEGEYFSLLIQLRFVKEQCFPVCRVPDKMSLAVHLQDGTHQEMVYSPLELVQSALHMKDRKDPQERTYLECVEGFFRNFAVGVRLNTLGGPIHTLILTGGTSNVNDIAKIAESLKMEDGTPAFARVLRDQNASTSVVNGLVHAISSSELEKLMKDVHGKTESTIKERTNELADSMTQIATRQLKHVTEKVVNPLVAQNLQVPKYRLIAFITEEMRKDQALIKNMETAFAAYTDVVAGEVLRTINEQITARFPGRIPEVAKTSISVRPLMDRVTHVIPKALRMVKLRKGPFATDSGRHEKMLSPRKMLRLVMEVGNGLENHEDVQSAMRDAVNDADFVRNVEKMLVDDTIRYITFTHFDLNNMQPPYV